MKTILITGANGQLGRAVRALYQGSASLILTEMAASADYTGLDITDLDQVLEFTAEHSPDVIINCAAMTNVDGCDASEDSAFRANAIGPRNLAIAAEKSGAKLIHISTDYVFSGDGTRPYTEFDAPAPVSTYGRSKLAGEEFVKQFCRRYFILRTAWLYGDGKNFVRTMISLSETHDEVSVVCDQKGSPTSASELARLIAHLEPTESYGLYHATCEGDTNWADFTEEIFRQRGISTRVNHVTSEEYAAMNPAAASRPKYSILSNYMLEISGSGFKMKDWKDALTEYLKG